MAGETRRAASSAKAGPREIFIRTLTRALRRVTPGQVGSCTFRVFGVGGFSVSVDLQRGWVLEGELERPSCVLDLGARAFRALLAGRLDVEAEAHAGELTVRGDPQVLAQLGELLDPGGRR